DARYQPARILDRGRLSIHQRRSASTRPVQRLVRYGLGNDRGIRSPAGGRWNVLHSGGRPHPISVVGRLPGNAPVVQGDLGALGSHTSNVLPRPGSLSTEIRPPCASTSPLVM